MFIVDVLVCAAAITISRFAERGIVLFVTIARNTNVRRVLIVGAGRQGRSLVRELRETPGQRVIGFVDDAPALRGRRLNGVKVVTNIADLAEALPRLAPDVVFMTIPDVGPDRLDALVRVCAAQEIELRIVRREIDVAPRVVQMSHHQ
jgi:FlaA1/EpsC-like NDP-sugar epimerase